MCINFYGELLPTPQMMTRHQTKCGKLDAVRPAAQQQQQQAGPCRTLSILRQVSVVIANLSYMYCSLAPLFSICALLIIFYSIYKPHPTPSVWVCRTPPTTRAASWQSLGSWSSKRGPLLGSIHTSGSKNGLQINVVLVF